MDKKYNWQEYLQILEDNGIHKLYHFTQYHCALNKAAHTPLV